MRHISEASPLLLDQKETYQYCAYYQDYAYFLYEDTISFFTELKHEHRQVLQALGEGSRRYSTSHFIIVEQIKEEMRNGVQK